MQILLTDKTWARIRENFTEDEKQSLRDQCVGETICPKGIIISDVQLDQKLSIKIQRLKDAR